KMFQFSSGTIKDNKIHPFFYWDDYKKISENYFNPNKELLKIADRICDNEFTFLSVTHKFDHTSNIWTTNKNHDKLWLYYLHYFEYLLELIESFYITDDKKYLIKAQKLIDDWIDYTSPGETNSWEAYTISIRLICWSYFWEVFEKNKNEIDNGFKKKFLGSIEQQSKFLYHNLEKDLANNHYTANGKALFWIGVSFPSIKQSETYLETGIEIL